MVLEDLSSLKKKSFKMSTTTLLLVNGVAMSTLGGGLASIGSILMSTAVAAYVVSSAFLRREKRDATNNEQYSDGKRLI